MNYLQPVYLKEDMVSTEHWQSTQGEPPEKCKKKNFKKRANKGWNSAQLRLSDGFLACTNRDGWLTEHFCLPVSCLARPKIKTKKQDINNNIL